MVAPRAFGGNAVRYLLVGAGGALGAMARYALDGLVLRLASPFFPSGTFVVNVVGCLIFGVIMGLADQRSGLTPTGRLFLLIGLLGGFTTFSTYTFETFQLVRDGQYSRGLFNAAGQVIAAYLALWAGYVTTRFLF
jgi:CrcB protein